MFAKLTAPTLCNLFGFAPSVSLMAHQLWRDYQYSLAHPAEKFCGTPQLATFMLGLLLTGAAACLASILAYFIYRSKPEKNWRIQVLLQALSPLYFLVITLGCWAIFS